MRLFLLLILSVMLMPGAAWGASACALSKTIEGHFLTGTADRFQIENQDQDFALAGLVIEDPDFSKIGLATGQALRLYPTDKTPDRYGRIKAYLYPKNSPSSVQVALLEKGMALVGPNVKNATCRQELLQAERRAQKRKTGLWVRQNVQFSATQPAKILQSVGKFALVRGKIVSLGDRKKRLYLNFGSNWKQDFTVIVEKTGKPAYREDISRLQRATGAFVRVRGIVEKSGGPMIRVTHEAQIEFDEYPAD